MIHPSKIVKLTASGDGNMGDVTKIDQEPRFQLDGADSYCLAYIRVRFFGGTGTGATMTWRTSHYSRGNYVTPYSGGDQVGSSFDFAPIDFENCGTKDNANVEFRVADDELRHYRLDRCNCTGTISQWVPEWVNPDPGDMNWAIELGLINVEDIPDG